VLRNERLVVPDVEGIIVLAAAPVLVGVHVLEGEPEVLNRLKHPTNPAAVEVAPGEFGEIVAIHVQPLHKALHAVGSQSHRATLVRPLKHAVGIGVWPAAARAAIHPVVIKVERGVGVGRVARNDVDHARHRAWPIERRRAPLYHLDAVDDSGGDLLDAIRGRQPRKGGHAIRKQ